MKVIEIAERRIGVGERCFIIAEAGVNHNGDMELAHRLVDAAADAGADAVKFQTFSAARLVSASARKADYQVATTGAEGSQFEMLRALELSAAAHLELQHHAVQRGLIFLSTPFDEQSVDFLLNLNLPAWKVSSGDITNLPFLEHLARTGRPILLSTGMSELAEVATAVEAIAGAGGLQIGLLHCVSAYPAPVADLNLRALDALRGLNAGPVGFSDHSLGLHLALGAVALGATMLEKHLTLDKELPGPDHRASLNPPELVQFVAQVREMELALGDGVKRARGEELANLSVGRKSLHWTRDLAVGSEVAAGDLIALRPATGLAPSALRSVLGRKIQRPVQAGTSAQSEDLSG